MSNLTLNSKIPSIRSLAPDVKKALVTINKDKKKWYVAANKEAGGKLFKTSFHDYSHSAPISINKLSNNPTSGTPLALSMEAENIARHYEDSILQGLPVAYRGADEVLHRDILKRGQEGKIGEAYKALNSLGKYSVNKKTQIPIDQIPGSKIILNKFTFPITSDNYIRL